MAALYVCLLWQGYGVSSKVTKVTLVSRIEDPVRLFFFHLFPQSVCLIWVYMFNSFFHSKWPITHGVVMTTFYYYSVNDQSGLQRNSFSKYTCINLLNHKVL